MWGEFGRTPRVNRNAGRDHWAPLSTLALSGGGLRMGQVIGSTSRWGEEPRTRPVHFREVFASLYQRRWLFAWLILHGLLLGVYAGSVYYKTQLRPSLSRANFPGPELARLIEADWQKKTGVPLAYLVGSTWAAGNVSFYATATPAVLINGDFSISPWVSPTRIKACGYVALWASEKSTREPGAWMSEMNPGLPEETAELSHPTQPAIRVAVRWVIIPPAGRCGA